MSSDEGKSRGFGFVCYEDPDSAEKACDEMHAKDINGKTLFVGRAQKRNERQTELRRKFEQMKIERLNRYQGVNLYVKNLDDSIDDERLRKEFAPYGTITSAKVMTEGGRSKGKQLNDVTVQLLQSGSQETLPIIFSACICYRDREDVLVHFLSAVN